MSRTIQTYNEEIDRWRRREERGANVDDFVMSDDGKIKWSETLKRNLQRGKTTDFSQEKVRASLYRPFTKSHLYFDRAMTERVYVFPAIFPTPETEAKNRVISVAGIGDRKGFGCLMANMIPSVDLAFEKIQCFPFYTYDEDSNNRREIHRLGMEQFREYYEDDSITTWDYSSIMFMLRSTIRIIESGIKRILSGNCRAFHLHRILDRSPAQAFGDLPKQGNGYRKFTSAMRTCLNISLSSSKLLICLSTGV